MVKPRPELVSRLPLAFASQAPPPPPGDTTKHFYDPVRAPPPPPSLKRAALEVFVRDEIRPRVIAICRGGLEGREHAKVCLAVAETLGKFQPIAGAGVLAPFCEQVCYKSCSGTSHADGQDDSFQECPSESCARSSCIDFLLAECPPSIHGELQSSFDKTCTLVPPSPPRPPAPPPIVNPAPPPPPPPVPTYQQRSRDDERDYDEDCELVSYAACRGIVADYARDHGTADVMSVSFAPCEGLPGEPSCFLVQTPTNTHKDS